MRFKPMPQYREGALLTDGASKTSPVGKMFIQPQVTLESGESVLLDERHRREFRHYRLGLQPAVGARRRADRPLARDWRALYPGGARGADPSRAG